MDDVVRQVIIRSLCELYKTKHIVEGSVIVLAVDPEGKHNPSAMLLKSLTVLPYIFQPVSQASITPKGVFLKSSRLQSCLIAISIIKPVQKGQQDQLQSEGVLYFEARRGNHWRVRLQKVKNKWQVSEAKIIAIH